MANETKNKVKFGLNKVYWAKITGYDEEGMPTYAACTSAGCCQS